MKQYLSPAMVDNSNNWLSLKTCFMSHVLISFSDASGADTDGESVSVMDGDSVTLHTEVETNQHHRIRWYFNDIRIAQINRDQRKICRDDQCKERFRDRLKLDHQTGSLTIMNTRTTDSGLYQLEIISSSISEKTFNVSVYGELFHECLKIFYFYITALQYLLFIVAVTFRAVL